MVGLRKETGGFWGKPGRTKHHDLKTSYGPGSGRQRYWRLIKMVTLFPPLLSRDSKFRRRGAQCHQRRLWPLRHFGDDADRQSKARMLHWYSQHGGDICGRSRDFQLSFRATLANYILGFGHCLGFGRGADRSTCSLCLLAASFQGATGRSRVALIGLNMKVVISQIG